MGVAEGAAGSTAARVTGAGLAEVPSGVGAGLWAAGLERTIAQVTWEGAGPWCVGARVLPQAGGAALGYVGRDNPIVLE